MPKTIAVVPLTAKFASQVITALRHSAEICSRQPETANLSPDFRNMALIIENTPVNHVELTG